MRLPIDPLTLAAIDSMYRSTLAALPTTPNATEEEKRECRQAAVANLAALGARDAQEAMLAASIVSAHYAAMECFRRAALAEVSDKDMLRLHARAASLTSLASRTRRELQKLQQAPPVQQMTEDETEEAAVPPTAMQPATLPDPPIPQPTPEPPSANDSMPDEQMPRAA